MPVEEGAGCLLVAAVEAGALLLEGFWLLIEILFWCWPFGDGGARRDRIRERRAERKARRETRRRR